MKKTNPRQLQNRLKLDRETVRVLTAEELREVAGGNETSSLRCSAKCVTGPACEAAH